MTLSSIEKLNKRLIIDLAFIALKFRSKILKQYCVFISSVKKSNVIFTSS